LQEILFTLKNAITSICQNPENSTDGGKMIFSLSDEWDRDTVLYASRE